ncbi:MAG: tetratricopeptide repeat protein, partial [Acidaminobacteraceae bacterium]
MNGNLSRKILNMLEESEKIYTSLPKRAYKISEEAYKLSVDNNMKSEGASSLVMMAKVCRIRTEVSQMYALSYDAYELFNELDDNLGMAKALNLIGITYYYRSMYEQAADTLIKGLKLIEIKDDFKLYSAILNNIGEVFKETENYDLAIEY